MKYLYGLEQIAVIKNVNPKLLNLDGVLLSHQGLLKLNERAAAKQMSHVEGQGVKRCNCKGICLSRVCSCFKNGVKCTSAFHKQNKKCQNY